jgi:putative peptidoglycan binding protein/glycosyl hydrolase family 46/TIR domain-containing protein
MKVFVSYSHRDAAYLAADSLLGHLKGLERDGVEFWWDERLVTGEDWDAEIRARIAGTDVALVLVSQSFLDSAYCTDVEISGFLQNARDMGLVIFPIILSACEWERHVWLRSRQFLPGGGQTVEEHYTDPGRRKRLFHEIRQDLRAQIDRIRQARMRPALQGPVPGTAAPTGTRLAADPALADRSGSTSLDDQQVPDAADNRLKATQQLLARIGAYNGPIDGVPTTAVRAAIRAFQRDQGLVADGVLGPQTAARLRAAAEGERSRPTHDALEQGAVAAAKRPLAITLIHETGKPRSYTAVYRLEGDLYYGVASSSLQRGSLVALLRAYTEDERARFAERVRPYLARLEAKDMALMEDQAFEPLLVRVAGEDPGMVRVQDAAIEASFFGPARGEAGDIGVTTALGYALIADTMVHSGRSRYERIKLATIRRLDGTPATGIDEHRWLRAFAEERVSAFAGRPFEQPVRRRTETFVSLMDEGRWSLASPLPVARYMLVDP